MAAREHETSDMQTNYSKWGTLIEDMGDRNSQGFLKQYVEHHHHLRSLKDAGHRQNLVSTCCTGVCGYACELYSVRARCSDMQPNPNPVSALSLLSSLQQNLTDMALRRKGKKKDTHKHQTVNIASLIVQPTEKMEKAQGDLKKVGERMMSMRALMGRQSMAGKRLPGSLASPGDGKASKSD